MSCSASNVRSTFHLHVGAGRLGIGLMMPAIIRSGVSFAVLQRPSKPWNLLNDVQGVTFYVNGEAICENLTVVRSLKTLPSSDSGTMPPWPNLFVLSYEPLLLNTLVSTATSFSISLGSAMLDVIIPLLSSLPRGGNRPTLYAAENNLSMVAELAKALEDCVEVVPCMVDRICVDRIIAENRVDVTCEEYEGEIVVTRQAENGLLAPFEGELVRRPVSDAQSNYFCRRKNLLVNGMHTTLAFMTLCVNQKKGGNSEYQEYCEMGDYRLIIWDPSACGSKTYQEIWIWAVARLAMLLWEHELLCNMSILLHAHGTKSNEQLVDDLLDYAVRILTRLSSISDTTSRVLNGGTGSRWETRLNTVNRFLLHFRPTPITSLLLQKANVKLSHMQKVVETLCLQSHRFTLGPHHHIHHKNHINKHFQSPLILR